MMCITKNFLKYVFDYHRSPIVKKIQEVFGMIVNPDYTVSGTTPDYLTGDLESFEGISQDMQKWWGNFRKSRLALHGVNGDAHGLMWVIQEWFNTEGIYLSYHHEHHTLELWR